MSADLGKNVDMLFKTSDMSGSLTTFHIHCSIGHLSHAYSVHQKLSLALDMMSDAMEVHIGHLSSYIGHSTLSNDK